MANLYAREQEVEASERRMIEMIVREKLWLRPGMSYLKGRYDIGGNS
jgi:hypothetical protein